MAYRTTAADQAHANPQLKSVARPTVTPTTTRGGPARPATTSKTGPASITTTFAGQVNDGYIQVRIGGDVALYHRLAGELRTLIEQRLRERVQI